jgi:serine/threonine protein phosphatase PrpC
LLTTDEVKSLCGLPNLTVSGGAQTMASVPCFLILASDGLWDVMSNEEAVDMVAEVLMSMAVAGNSVSLQEAAETLTLDAYVRGSRDNIGVAVIAV